MRIVGAIFISLLMAASTSEVMARDSIRLYGLAAIGQGLTSLGDRAGTGVGGALAIGYSPGNKSAEDIELRIRAGYDFLPANNESSPDFSLVTLGLDLKLNIKGLRRRNLYFLLGGGAGFIRWSAFESSGLKVESESETKLYLSPGIGIASVRAGLSPFLQIRLFRILGPPTGDYQFLSLGVGVRLQP